MSRLMHVYLHVRLSYLPVWRRIAHYRIMGLTIDIVYYPGYLQRGKCNFATRYNCTKGNFFKSRRV